MPVLPPELPALAAVFLAVLTLLALVSHTPGEESAAAGPEGIRNHLGLLGAHVSALLVRLFGMAAFWPVPALLLYPFYRLTARGREVTLPAAASGIVLFVFSLLALGSTLFPDRMPFPWPASGAAGGGALGSLLAGGMTRLAGRVGTLAVLPALLLSGFMLFTGIPPGALGRLLVRPGGGAGEEASGDARGEPPRLVLRGRAGRPEGAGDVPGRGGAGAGEGLPEGEGGRDPDGREAAGRQEERREAERLDRGARQAAAGGQDALAAGLEADPDGPGAAPGGGRGRPAPREELKIRQRPRPAGGDGSAARGPYRLPSTDLLDPPPEAPEGGILLSREELMANAAKLETKLLEFGVEGKVLEVAGGPVITMYEYTPAPGIKISKVEGLSNDLTMAMRAESIRVVAPIPGKNAIGIELPNARRSVVSLRELVESREFRELESPLSLVLGVDITGGPVVTDLGRMPHLLIAGATGSGKSVGLDCMIMSILYKAGPDRVRFLMIDPKCVELALYRDLPHLIHPVLTDPAEATTALKWAVCEMDARYRLMAERGVRNIQGYNDLAARGGAGDPAGGPPGTLPYLVIIIDELSDLMLTSPKEVEVSIMRLCAKARASGIHLILATQRPSVDVLTGVIKANLPTRISFQVATRFDSRTILDQTGAEQLLGKGDMLFMPPGTSRVR
ncbi:MAG: DNA translocase FtsK 4TM domain-containing protein, partial [Deltaproteobacteria bacterium]|nr:DNA translocase FtsK 4TM domain-containing protein [Deltaproteobacteria bacterium]